MKLIVHEGFLPASSNTRLGTLFTRVENSKGEIFGSVTFDQIKTLLNEYDFDVVDRKVWMSKDESDLLNGIK